MSIFGIVRAIAMAALVTASISGTASAQRWTFENSQDPMNDTSIRTAMLEVGQNSDGERGLLAFACRADGVVRTLVVLGLFDMVFDEDRVTYRFDNSQPQSDTWQSFEGGGRAISGNGAIAFLDHTTTAQERLVFRSEGRNRQLVFRLPSQPEFTQFAAQCRSWHEASQARRQSSATVPGASTSAVAPAPIAPPAPRWTFSADRTAIEDADRRFASLEVEGPDRFERSTIVMLCADDGAFVFSVLLGRLDVSATIRSRDRRVSYRIDDQPPRDERWEKPGRDPGSMLFDQQAIALMREISSARHRFVFRNDRGTQMTFTWDMSQAQHLQEFVAQCEQWGRALQRPQPQPARPQGQQPRR